MADRLIKCKDPETYLLADRLPKDLEKALREKL